MASGEDQELRYFTRLRSKSAQHKSQESAFNFTAEPTDTRQPTKHSA